MKTKLCGIRFLRGAFMAVLMIALRPAFSEMSPITSWDGSYSEYSRSYREQDGYAIVLGHKLHYWLYDTYTNNNGNGWAIFNQVVPKWVENMGYAIDFDNMQKYSPNTSLANSVKALMKQRGCDVSVTLITRESGYPTKTDYVVINSYDISQDRYWTVIYHLIK